MDLVRKVRLVSPEWAYKLAAKFYDSYDASDLAVEMKRFDYLLDSFIDLKQLDQKVYNLKVEQAFERVIEKQREHIRLMKQDADKFYHKDH